MELELHDVTELKFVTVSTRHPFRKDCSTMSGRELIFNAGVCPPVGTGELELWFIRWFGFWPQFIIAFATAIIFFHNSVFAIITVLIMVTGFYQFLKVLGQGFGVRREAEYVTRCNALEFMFPDALFVIAVSFPLILTLAVANRKIMRNRATVFREAVVLIYFTGWLTTVVVSEYLPVGWMVANFALAVVFGVAYWFIYEAVAHLVWDGADEIWKNRLDSFANAMGTRMRRKRTKQEERRAALESQPPPTDAIEQQ